MRAPTARATFNVLDLNTGTYTEICDVSGRKLKRGWFIPLVFGDLAELYGTVASSLFHVAGLNAEITYEASTVAVYSSVFFLVCVCNI